MRLTPHSLSILFITTKIKAANCQDKGNYQLLFAILVHTSITKCNQIIADVTPILRQYEVEGYDAINIEMYLNASITGGYIFPKQGCYLCSANRHQATVPANPAIPVAASITILIKPSSEPVSSRTGIVQGK